MTLTGSVSWLRANWKTVLVVLTTALVAAALGHLVHPLVTTVTKVQYQDRLVNHDVVKTVTVEKPVITYRTRTITKTVYLPGSSSPSSVTTVVEGSGSQSGGTVTQSSSVETTKEVATGTSSTSTAPEGRWSVRILAGLSTSSGTVVGAGADYRLVGPLTVGAWVTTSLGSPSFSGGVALGLRL